MERAPSEEELKALADQLDQERSLPGKSQHNRVVYWHVFRRSEDAWDMAGHVRLGKGDHLVGGKTRDSIGALWWVGVEVDDLAAWGNRAAVHKVDKVDPENPDSPML